MMKSHGYKFLAAIFMTVAFLFSGPALAEDIDAKLSDAADASSFQVKNSSDSVLMKVQSGGDVGIGTTNPEEKLDVNGNVQIRGTNGKLVFPSSHYDAKIELFKNGEEKIGTGDHQLKFIAGSGPTANIAFFGDSTEVMRVETGSGGNVGIGTNSPNSTLHVNGSFSVKRIGVTSADTPYTSSGETIIAVTSVPPVAEFSVILASADCVEGRIVYIKDESGSAGSYGITISTQGSESIDGSNSYLISDDYGSLKVYSNGTDWFIIGAFAGGGA